MKNYEGQNTTGVRRVTVNGAPLPMEPRLTDDPLTSFSWGDKSAGAQQLAYSLLADAADESHTILWQDFLEAVVSKLDRGHWKLTDADISEFCDHVSSIIASIPPDESWTSGGSSSARGSTVQIPISSVPKIESDPNYHLKRADKKK
jgi:hypothetical protein